jgi:PPOX class probable F420-dependent enzyme
MMTVPESHRDLLKTDTAILATIGLDGYPQVTALWFLYDNDGKVKLSLKPERQKVKNLQKHDECTFFIIDRANPLRTLEIRGSATISPDEDYAFANKLGRKYGVDLRQMDGPGEHRVVITLEPIKINAIDLSRG